MINGFRADMCPNGPEKVRSDCSDSEQNMCLNGHCGSLRIKVSVKVCQRTNDRPIPFYVAFFEPVITHQVAGNRITSMIE